MEWETVRVEVGEDPDDGVATDALTTIVPTRDLPSNPT